MEDFHQFVFSHPVIEDFLIRPGKRGEFKEITMSARQYIKSSTSICHISVYIYIYIYTYTDNLSYTYAYIRWTHLIS